MAKPPHPAAQVVGDHVQRQPGRVSAELAAGHVVECRPVLEIADHVLDHCVLAVVGLPLQHRALSVGDEGIVAVGHALELEARRGSNSLLTLVFVHLLRKPQLRHLGLMPRHYVRFLDDAARRILLYKDGGGYRFMHRLFLDYFADLEAEPSRALSTAQGTGMAQEQTNGVTAAPQSS